MHHVVHPRYSREVASHQTVLLPTEFKTGIKFWCPVTAAPVLTPWICSKPPWMTEFKKSNRLAHMVRLARAAEGGQALNLGKPRVGEHFMIAGIGAGLVAPVGDGHFAGFVVCPQTPIAVPRRAKRRLRPHAACSSPKPARVDEPGGA